jgi:lysophospholipase L1-like esterase
MNTQQKNIVGSKTTTVQAASNTTGKEGKVLTDNRFAKTIQKKELSLNTNTVIQLGKKKKTEKPISKGKKTEKLVTIKKKIVKKRKGNRELERLLSNWSNPEVIKQDIDDNIVKYKIYIENIRKQLDDDEDIELIDLYNAELDEIDSSNTYHLEDERKKLNNIIKELKFHFPLHSGGFGAKGRAHAIDVEYVAKTDKKTVPKGKNMDNHFLEGIKVDGETNGQNVYKETSKVSKEKSGPLQIIGQTYNKNDTINKKKSLTDLDKGLYNIETPQDKTFTNTPVGKDRGFGQYANMNNTNAAGYAWLLDIPGAESQRWEWLHVRGAGIGGATDSTNLVAGTRDANTHMIPFESNIRSLGAAVGNNKDKYSKLEVKWSVTTKVANHAYQWIRIAWSLFKKNKSVQTQGEAYFQPLHTGSNISKSEVEKLENALQEAREKL